MHAWILFTALGLAAAPPHQHHHQTGAEEGVDKPSTDSVYNLGSTWTDAEGRARKLSSLRGQPVVLAMVYTSCQAVCPLIVSDMKTIEQRLPPELRGKVRFVAVSFDPARDTPERLKKYMGERDLAATHWTLLTGPDDDVRELAAVLGMRYRPAGNGEFVHSNLISVLGPDGVIRHQQVGIGQDPAASIDVVTRLAADEKTRAAPPRTAPVR